MWSINKDESHLKQQKVQTFQGYARSMPGVCQENDRSMTRAIQENGGDHVKELELELISTDKVDARFKRQRSFK